MAETKRKAQERKQQRKPAPGEVKKAEKMPEAKAPSRKYLYVIALVIIIAAAVIIALPYINSVSFSTFKSNFDNSQRVSLVVGYSNLTQYGLETPCFTSIVQVIAHSRKASTIDFFLIDQQNSTCLYSKTGLGGDVNLTTASSSYCLGIAGSEPAIFLNYSSSNYTSVSLLRVNAYGNSAYMSQCPIAIELS